MLWCIGFDCEVSCASPTDKNYSLTRRELNCCYKFDTKWEVTSRESKRPFFFLKNTHYFDVKFEPLQRLCQANDFSRCTPCCVGLHRSVSCFWKPRWWKLRGLVAKSLCTDIMAAESVCVCVSLCGTQRLIYIPVHFIIWSENFVPRIIRNTINTVLRKRHNCHYHK